MLGYSFDLFSSKPYGSSGAGPSVPSEWTHTTSGMFASRSVAPGNAVGLSTAFAAPVRSDAGDQAGRFSKAMSYAGHVQDLFGTLAELGGGEAGRRAFAPTSYLLNGAGAGATFLSSQQRGEPIDVALVRAGSPLVGAKFGELGGGLLGSAVGGLAGSEVPILGSGLGAIAGGTLGKAWGSYEGEKLGDEGSDWYAKFRGSGR